MGSRVNLGMLGASVDATRQQFGKLGAVLSSTKLDNLFGNRQSLGAQRDAQRSRLSLLAAGLKPGEESPSPSAHKGGAFAQSDLRKMSETIFGHADDRGRQSLLGPTAATHRILPMNSSNNLEADAARQHLSTRLYGNRSCSDLSSKANLIALRSRQ